jgi:hypothetical protein
VGEAISIGGQTIAVREVARPDGHLCWLLVASDGSASLEYDPVQKYTPFAKRGSGNHGRGGVRTCDLSRVKGDEEGADSGIKPPDKPDSGD